MIFDNKLSYIVEKEIKDIPERYKGWNVDFNIIMPNHIHMIFSADDVDCPLGRVIGGFKSLVYKRARDEFNIRQSLWQTNYYEHIIRNEDELKKLKLYIEANPSDEIIHWDDIDRYVV